jgi:hypothetical protein
MANAGPSETRTQGARERGASKHRNLILCAASEARSFMSAALFGRLRTQSRAGSAAVGCVTVAMGLLLAAPAPAQADFGFQPGSASVQLLNRDGTVDEQASTHPYSLALHAALKTGAGGFTEGGEMRDLAIDLPPGLVGNPLAVPRCPRQSFEGGHPHCPAETQVGVLRAILPGVGETFGPLFNLSPSPGVPVQVGFKEAGLVVLGSARLRSEEGYGARVLSPNLPVEASSFTATIWGVPADPHHDPERYCTGATKQGCETGAPELPFLTLPASCSEPLAFGFEADSALAPGAFASQTAYTRDAAENLAALGGCEAVPFAPRIASQLSTRAAETGSGLDFELQLPNQGLLSPGGIAETEPSKMEVTLPEGVTANPSAAEGLATCTEAQYKAEQLESKAGEGCPEASKIGSIEAHSPLLEEAVEGSLYLAKPYENKTKSLIGLYLVARAQERGVLIKQALKVEPDPKTGRLVTTIEELPPLPYSDVKLHFREGARSLLVSPPSCGEYKTQAKLYPFSNPNQPYETSASFQIERGVNGGACPSGGLPFHPGFEAGTLNNAAAAHSPLLMRLTRQDGDQDLTKISTTLPQGLLASLVGVGKCPDADIAQARSRTGPHGGEEELHSPSCPASSQIGTTMTGAGVGGVLTYVPGNLYLAGPYNGAPLSIVAVVPGVAGPFDVGTIVVRLALRFNPITAQAEADGASSDPIPHILRGIPLKVRDIRVYVNRPNWTFNPTSCEAEATVGTLWGGGQNAFSSADDNPFALAARFQAADCANLAFKPNLKLKLKGGTKRGKFPALRGEYKPRPGDANLNGLVLRLPSSEFIEQGHFQTICTRVQYAAGAGFGSQCPAGSVYGWATAYTPLLEEPLEGPVRLRSSNHNLPDLVASLHGIADIEAVARIDSKDGGLRATFSGLPDAPITKVIVQMQGGKKGLIVNSTNICVGSHKANATYTAQSGKRAEGNPALAAKCPQAKKRKRGGR